MTIKRIFDMVVSAMAVLVTLPLLLLVAAAIYVYDFHNPFYVAPRIGKGGVPFRMVKFRSMVVNADKSGVTSTAATDGRITPVGRLVRRCKLDELVQLWNVLRGDMSLVGPRPNVPSGVAVYTVRERDLLRVRPGITDFASIVFADEGEILRGHPDPDLAYDQLIRPWKSRLALFYVSNSNLILDLRLIGLTALAIVSRPAALRRVTRLLQDLGAPADVLRVSSRREDLQPAPLPGADQTGTAQYGRVGDTDLVT